jgi:hypothetical protein
VGKLSKQFSAGNLHPRENYAAAASLVLNGELIIDCDGCSSFLLDLRGTFNGTIEVSGCSTVDGATYTAIPVVPVNTNSRAYVVSVVGTVQGLWEGKCAGYTKIRARCTASSGGPFLVNLVASNGLLDDSLSRKITQQIVTNTGVAGAGVTLSLPGLGSLKTYVTFLEITRFAAAGLTPGATPVIVTTTNLPGTLAFSLPADAAAQGTVFVLDKTFDSPLAPNSQSTGTTFVAPPTPNVIWRMTAGYYAAP